ncbi:MAG: hypothetical protein JWP59_3586 [Massilia sp.]|nr:hypothetical protein [Massilia sp.]
MPVDQKVTSQQGATFTWTANTFDDSARPVSVTRASSLGFTRTETTEYADNYPAWVLGQIKKVTESSTGKFMVENGYNASSALLESVKKFSLVQQTMTYNPDGTLATKSDALGHSTTFSNYKRGIPQNVQYADGSTESASVNDDGTIEWIIDPLNNKTSFKYEFGRLSKIIYPPEPNGLPWNETTLSFTKVNSNEFGLDAGHWRQDVVTGNGWTRTYLDALWRPVYTWTYENNVATGQSMAKTEFDHAGRATFSSYPQTGFGADLTKGVRTFYDVLGRTTEVRADSELGPLSTYTTYESGFQKVVRDPRNNVNRFSFQAFDTPTEDAVIRIDAPESLVVTITRNIFDLPKAVTRSGNGVSVTRTFVNDTHGRLCKTIEPETGSTVQSLDDAGNVTWRAVGTTYTSTGTCSESSVASAAKISYTYDARNRLRTTKYGDGSPSVTRTYWPDGQPKTVSSAGAVWTMNYNSRRLPTTQSLAFEGQTYTIGTDYNANGHATQLTYPAATNAIANRTVSYDPDALGRPSHVGSYANGIGYHPNGAVAGFTYGNGRVRTLTQNTRGLPEISQDAGVIHDGYAYDANGNVNGITDYGNGSVRSMEYDGRDRLTVANAPAIWGNASYGYDVLDNLKTSTIGGRVSSYNYGARNLLDSLQSTASGFSYNYAYDIRGNVTSRNGQVFTFDLGNRLTTAANLDTYVYDGFGRRVKTTAVDGTVTITVYSPAGQLLYTRRTGGPNPAQSTQYIYLHSHQIAEVKK